MSPGIAITLNLRLLKGPALNDEEDAVLFYSLRIRLTRKSGDVRWSSWDSMNI